MSDLKYAPMGDRVLVAKRAPETVRESGLVLPDGAEEKEAIGVVAAIGPDVDRHTIPVGCEVVYSKYGGSGVKLGDEEYLIFRVFDLLLVRVVA